MAKEKKHKTKFVFPKTSFHIGLGSVLNIPGNYYRFKLLKHPFEADKKAIENDWAMVGQDIETAIKKFWLSNGK